MNEDTTAPDRPRVSRQQAPRTLSRTKKACFGFVTTVLGLVTIELALTLVGVGRSTDQADPLMGFSRQVPLLERFVDEDGKTWMRTAENKLVWFNDQRFPLNKPANTQRIFCLGGSTTFGRPYDDNTSFAGWLREWLPHVDGARHHEVFNAGGVSYASYRVAAVMEELKVYEPDLFIVYTGQNEFLERRTYADFFDQSQAQLWLTGWLNKTRTYGVIESIVRKTRQPKRSADSIDLAAEVDERLNHTVGPSDYVRDEEWSNNVREHFRFNVRRMISMARSADAKILFVVPASNEKDCSPFKPGPDEDWFESGRRAFEAGDFDVAQSAFRAAIDRDICPLRASSDFAAFIRELPESDDVRVLDFDASLRDVCRAEQGHGVLGEEYFLDHVHPTIEAHRQLSRWLISEMQDAGWLPEDSIALDELPPETVAEVDRSVWDRIDRTAQGIAMRNLAKVMHWAGKFEVAEPRARDAIRMLDGDVESQFILADCLRWIGRIDESVAEFEQGVKAYPDYYRGLQRYGQLLLELGEYESARDLLVVAAIGWPESDPRHWSARFQLAVAHLGASDFEAAHSELLRCHEHAPDDLDVVFALAEASAGIGKSEVAIELYERVLDAFPDDVETHLNLAYTLLRMDQTRRASMHFETALLLAPDNTRAKAGMTVIGQLDQSSK
ncbi:tetratricopeptide repeat protein [Rhodopirellula sp. P2]|uniref:tetratricopeptide repeat protein n=1 Tax=Rhodopirellula sp. P2 TaxID=2127060 RepID=UPI002367A957|nr:tetratricopeptide repeat protein [Rhodopirellula sp. P2]WDQ15788.1 tetratricopeptide repeat protein [Rhodopirellula sp. P2]